MGLPLAGKTVFEPGAGVGDQTAWLLDQDVKSIIVNDGRIENLGLIKRRFGSDAQITYVHGNLENCLDRPDFQFTVDFIFLWGVYYHLDDSYNSFKIMRSLARIGPIIAFDYLEGDDTTALYPCDDPSVAISRRGIRPTTPTLMKNLKKIWGYAYLPKIQLDWHDPLAPDTPRRIAVASRLPLDNPQLILQ
jgi:hypothetical protein